MWKKVIGSKHKIKCMFCEMKYFYFVSCDFRTLPVDLSSLSSVEPLCCFSDSYKCTLNAIYIYFFFFTIMPQFAFVNYRRCNRRTWCWQKVEVCVNTFAILPLITQNVSCQMCAQILGKRKCNYTGNCTFAHSQEEKEMWMYMKNNEREWLKSTCTAAAMK